MPALEEFIGVRVVVVKHLAQAAGVLLLLRVLVDEEENDCLEEALGTVFTVLADQIQEGFLVCCPVLDDAPLWIENAAQEDVVFVVRSDVEDELNLANLSQ